MDTRVHAQRMPFGATLAMIVFGGGLLGTLPACSTPQDSAESAQNAVVDPAPAAKELAGPSPSAILSEYRLHAPPRLGAAADVAAFLDWTGASHVDEEDDVRSALAAAAQNKEVISALIAEVERVQRTDQPRALLALGLLGETRSADAQNYFTVFVRRPLPSEGTVVDGEIIEQTLAAQLQGKAVDGLAFINTASANEVVLEVAARHASKIVRAEAINAYLWNHGDSAEARARLAQVVQQGEQILIDRVRRIAGEKADTFDPKLARFLRQHPEASATAPERGTATSPPDDPAPGDPPPEF
jgi:hypothetical protein